MLLGLIEITDFLSTKGTIRINCDPKVTILLGSNDHGKTNILEAIKHLNDDVPITEDETNWDAAGTPAISFIFSLSSAERKEWKALIEDVVARKNAAIRQAAESAVTPKRSEAIEEE